MRDPLDLYARDVTGEADAERRVTTRKLKWQYFAIGIAAMGIAVFLFT